MHAFVSLALLIAARLANAGIYVTNPVQATSCAGDLSCQVEWVDDGQAPLLSAIGECDVGLYTGTFQLVQSLPSVDVSTTSSFSFTPNPSVGPNGPYYLVFSASNSNYRSFSGSFTLAGMSGTTPGATSVPATPATTVDLTTSAPGTTSSPSPSTIVPTTSITSGTTSTPHLTTTTSFSSTSTTSNTSSTISTTSSSASPSAANAAVRVGSSSYLGGLAALFALSGVFVF